MTYNTPRGRVQYMHRVITLDGAPVGSYSLKANGFYEVYLYGVFHVVERLHLLIKQIFEMED